MTKQNKNKRSLWKEFKEDIRSEDFWVSVGISLTIMIPVTWLGLWLRKFVV